MTEIRNDLAPDDGRSDQARNVEHSNSLQSVLFDQQLQEVMDAFLQRRQAAVMSDCTVLSLVGEIRADLSEAISQAKEAISGSQRVGFLASGHSGFSLVSLAGKIAQNTALLEEMVVSGGSKPTERQLAYMIYGVLEALQTSLLGIDLSDLNRSEVYSLLPVFQETKQVLMEVELKSSLGMFGGAPS